MKKIFIALMIAFTAMSSFATEYDTVYSCGFEKDENASNWILEAKNLSNTIRNSDCSNLFAIGTASKFAGERGLYVSQDKGNSNSIVVASESPYLSSLSFVYANVELPTGDYSYSFIYKLPKGTSVMSAASFYVFENNTEYNTPLHTKTLSNTTDWNIASGTFNLEKECHGIAFDYVAFSPKGEENIKIEGLTIDSIIIKKAKSSTSANSATEEDLIVYGLDGKVRIAGTQARATIYNIGGAKVYEGADREIALPSGIYVVRIGEMAKKVIVK